MPPSNLIERLLALWNEVPPAGEAGLAAFLELYTDPVRLNGAESTINDMVARARALAATRSGRRTELLSQLRWRSGFTPGT
ncbi:MAG: hypothetical protein K0R38_5475 [Polyangiaceae bacterium]|jgi:hypothetical protein|nr:hypothetical protein [Polyangiaceae bacterium]